MLISWLVLNDFFSHASSVSVGMVHQFDPDSNISQLFFTCHHDYLYKWNISFYVSNEISQNLRDGLTRDAAKNMRDTQTMNPSDFDDTLTFDLAPPWSGHLGNVLTTIGLIAMTFITHICLHLAMPPKKQTLVRFSIQCYYQVKIPANLMTA